MFESPARRFNEQTYPRTVQASKLRLQAQAFRGWPGLEAKPKPRGILWWRRAGASLRSSPGHPNRLLFLFLGRFDFGFGRHLNLRDGGRLLGGLGGASL